MDKKGVLLVDDEAAALKYFSKSFGDRFSVYSALSAEEALQILETHRDKIGVVVTDQRMPESSGVDLLRIVRDRFPLTTRILTTAYTDLDLLIEAINTGAVYSFVAKPWDLNQLEQTLYGAMEHHMSLAQSKGEWIQKIDDFRAKILEDYAYDIGLISAKIGHYVHNALCPLAFLIDQLLDRSKDSTDYPIGFLQSIRTHVYEISRTLKELGQVSTPVSKADYRLLDLEEILERALVQTEILRKQKHLRIEKDPAGRIPAIKGVPSQIEKLFRFMIAEEIVSLPAESLVRVQISEHVADDALLGVNIEFEDFAPVAPQFCPETLLHPFNLRGSNPREFGIFLVSCYFIARHHGGSLSAKVKDDRGLSFTFFLPCDPAKVSIQETKSFSPHFS